jgi:hypothetical protein
MRKFFLSSAAAFALASCASLTASPPVVQANVNAVVSDTDAITRGGIGILDNLAKAALSALKPIEQLIGVVDSL